MRVTKLCMHKPYTDTVIEKRNTHQKCWNLLQLKSVLQYLRSRYYKFNNITVGSYSAPNFTLKDSSPITDVLLSPLFSLGEDQVFDDGGLQGGKDSARPASVLHQTKL